MLRVIHVCVLALISTAAAAGQPPSGSGTAHDWSGFYLGINAGYGFGKARSSYIDFMDPSANGSESLPGKGLLVGGQAGFNWQHGKILYGIEADIQHSDVKHEVFESDGGDHSTLTYAIDWFGTKRGRVGYIPVDNTVLYATAGLAYGQMALSVRGYDSVLGAFSFGISDRRFGWTAGLGAEVAFDDRWSVKTEYLYTDLGKWVMEDDDGRSTYTFGFHTVRAGLNFAF